MANANDIHSRLARAGIELSASVLPVANYVPCVQADDPLVFVSGQGTRSDGSFRYIGKVGEDFTWEDGYAAARLCAINVLRQLQSFCGVENISQVVKLTGFVNAASNFTDLPRVLNGASDVMVDIFGDIGRHSRSTIGVATLPFGMAVEVEGIFAVRRKRIAV